MQVSADYFDAFGLRPILGRTFVAGEDQPGHDRLVLLSWGLWQRRFGGDSAVRGKIMTVNGIPREIIGVMPNGVRYPPPAEMWAPYAPTPETGGDQATVQRLVVRQGISPAAIGLLVGLMLAPALTTLVRGMLVGVSPHDPLTFGAVGSLLLGVALFACWLPAPRAARVDPMIALRTE